MSRLTALVPLLCLALSCVQATMWCGYNRRNQCVRHDLCDTGLTHGRPQVDFRTLQDGNQGCRSTEQCCPLDKILPESTHSVAYDEPQRSDCGQVNQRGLSFTIRSPQGLAQENELPWMMALLHKDNTYLGGGSLIALDVVLTAHHVTKQFDSSELVVRAGEWDFNTETEKFPYVEVGVRLIVKHPSFDTTTGANNLALLFLEKPLDPSRHIRPICLPSRNQNFDRKRCIVSGWGKDAIKQNKFMNIMKKVDLPVVDHGTCEGQLDPYKEASFRLHYSLMCAGGEEGKDACFGDGGSPLACPLEDDPDRFEQAGIVNWGVGCGMANVPGVYTDVAKFRSWIDEQIRSYSIAKEGLKLDENEPPRKQGFWYNPTQQPPRGVYDETTRPPKRTDYSPYRPQYTTRRTERPPTRDPNEIDPESFLDFTSPSTTQFEPIPMQIIKSK